MLRIFSYIFLFHFCYRGERRIYCCLTFYPLRHIVSGNISILLYFFSHTHIFPHSSIEVRTPYARTLGCCLPSGSDLGNTAWSKWQEKPHFAREKTSNSCSIKISKHLALIECLQLQRRYEVKLEELCPGAGKGWNDCRVSSFSSGTRIFFSTKNRNSAGNIFSNVRDWMGRWHWGQEPFAKNH